MHVTQFDMEHIAKQEKERIEGLVLRRGSYLSVNRQMTDLVPYIGRGRLDVARPLPASKDSTCPSQVTPFGSW